VNRHWGVVCRGASRITPSKPAITRTVLREKTIRVNLFLALEGRQMAPKDVWEEVREAIYEFLDASEQSHLRALGDEYVEAMRSGAKLRELAEEKPHSELKSGRIVSNPLWEAADRDIRRGFSSRRRSS
jgi:hypothetical protein